jgi:glucosamine-6-phosphate deaminase
MFHIVFWEPHRAAEFANKEEWMKPAYRLGAKFHLLKIEQDAITRLKAASPWSRVVPTL